MVEEAIILVSTLAGEKTMEDVYKEIMSLEGVEKAAMIAGQHDVIAWIETDSTEEISILIKTIRNIEGVEETTTNVVINPSNNK